MNSEEIQFWLNSLNYFAGIFKKRLMCLPCYFGTKPLRKPLQIYNAVDASYICKRKIAESGYKCYTIAMTITRKLPVGVQSFKDLRKKNFLYVDKTEYLFRLVNNGKVYFLSRPRRFGKSLFLSTLEAYFLGQKELFKGLYVEQAEESQADQEGRAAWETYPVLYLDFNTGNYGESDDLSINLNNHLCKWE